MGVDDIARGCFTAKLTNRPRDFAVQPLLANTPEKPGNERLAGTASPDLGDATGGSDDLLAAASGCFDQRRHLPIAALEADQATRVKNEAHLGDPLATSRRGAFQDSVSVTHLGIGERPERLLPCRDSLRQRFESQSIAGGLRQPRRNTLSGARRRRADRLTERQVERRAHLLNAHAKIVPR